MRMPVFLKNSPQGNGSTIWYDCDKFNPAAGENREDPEDGRMCWLLQLPTACTGGCTTIAIISSSMTKHTLKRTGPCPSLPDRPMNLTGCWEKTCSHSLGSPAETHQVTPHSASTGLLPDLAPVFLTGTRRSLIISKGSSGRYSA